MGTWQQRPTGWPPCAPSPTEPGFTGWAQHWVASLSPLWLSLANSNVPLRTAARRTWRHLAAETAALERSVDVGGGLRQALADAGVSPEAAAEILGAVDAEIERRRMRLQELRQVGARL